MNQSDRAMIVPYIVFYVPGLILVFSFCEKFESALGS